MVLSQNHQDRVQWWFPGAGEGENKKLLFNRYYVSDSQDKKSYRDGWW